MDINEEPIAKRQKLPDYCYVVLKLPENDDVDTIFNFLKMHVHGRGHISRVAQLHEHPDVQEYVKVRDMQNLLFASANLQSTGNDEFDERSVSGSAGDLVEPDITEVPSVDHNTTEVIYSTAESDWEPAAVSSQPSGQLESTQNRKVVIVGMNAEDQHIFVRPVCEVSALTTDEKLSTEENPDIKPLENVAHQDHDYMCLDPSKSYRKPIDEPLFPKLAGLALAEDARSISPIPQVSTRKRIYSCTSAPPMGFVPMSAEILPQFAATTSRHATTFLRRDTAINSSGGFPRVEPNKRHLLLQKGGATYSDLRSMVPSDGHGQIPHYSSGQIARPKLVYSAADPSLAAMANAPAPLIVSSRSSRPSRASKPYMSYKGGAACNDRERRKNAVRYDPLHEPTAKNNTNDAFDKAKLVAIYKEMQEQIRVEEENRLKESNIKEIPLSCADARPEVETVRQSNSDSDILLGSDLNEECAGEIQRSTCKDISQNILVGSSGSENTDDNNNSEGDYVTRCICGYENINVDMIACDKCSVWQHLICMGIDSNANLNDFAHFCELCSPRKLKYTHSEAREIQKPYYIMESEMRKKSITKRHVKPSDLAAHSSSCLEVPAPKQTGSTMNSILLSSTYSKRVKRMFTICLPSFCVPQFDLPPGNNLFKRTFVAAKVEGLVANVNINENSPIVELIGNVCLPDECGRDKDGFYEQNNVLYDGLGGAGPSVINNFFCIDCRKQDVDAHFARRSCRPNCVLRHSIANFRVNVWIVSNERILAGNEITIPFDCDYLQTMNKKDCTCYTASQNTHECLLSSDPVAVPLGHRKRWSSPAKE